MFRDLLFIHIVAVSLWLGGQLFFLAVVLPALHSQPDEPRSVAVRKIGQQFMTVSIPVLFVILVTGIIMASEAGFLSNATTAFNWKMGSVAVVLASTVVHVIAARHDKLRLSRMATAMTGVSTLFAVWFAVHL